MTDSGISTQLRSSNYFGCNFDSSFFPEILKTLIKKMTSAMIYATTKKGKKADPFHRISYPNVKEQDLLQMKVTTYHNVRYMRELCM